MIIPKKRELWRWDPSVDAYVITTNGSVTHSGRAVMGQGNALEAVTMFPALDPLLGEAIRKNGPVVCDLGIHIYRGEPRVDPYRERPYRIVAFPVKYEWRERASLNLIERSAQQLMQLVEKMGWKHVLLPRPGVGYGGRDWAREVEPILRPVLDYRVMVITKPWTARRS